MNNKRSLKEQFNKTYLRPVMALLVFILIDSYFIISYSKAAYVVTALIVLYLITIICFFIRRREAFVEEVLDITTKYGQVQKRLIKEIPLPFFLLNEDGTIFWMNEQAKDDFNKDRGYQKHISTLLPDIDDKFLMQLQEDAEVTINLKDLIYNVELTRIEFEENEEFSGGLISVILYDKTEFYKYKTQVEEQKMIVGLIYLDNYDETLNNMEDVKISLFSALLERKIKKYFSAEDGIVRKMDKDKFMVILKAKNFRHLESERFTLLSDIKSVNIGDDVTVTISMGFGLDAPSYESAWKYASAAIEIALGRGGDQAVIKSANEQAYYGGATSQMNRNTRVKARVKAQAFRELVTNADHIFIMGHEIADIDAFGASVGTYRALSSISKKSSIVLDSIPAALKPFTDMYNKELGMFISSETAITAVSQDSVVVVVDTNKPSLCECPKLLDMTRNIAVFDHHRQGTESIRNAVLAYVEPYASSTCEMVTEMLPYIDENIKIKREDADCMYAGIVIDTNNFMSKTGVRTFEAATYLRRNGADATRVRRMLREDMSSYKYKAQIILNTEVYKDQYAIGICQNEELKTPTVIGAQAANELLNIIGIKASFVLTPYNGMIYVSARSEDLNVQLIMEKLGGGGHMSTAGTQLRNCTLEEAKNTLKEAIDQMIKE